MFKSMEETEEKKVESFTSKEIIEALEAIHDPAKWAFFIELRIGTGYGKDSEQRFDAWAINYFPSKRNVTRCYEVKVSRADFFNEIKKPFKRRAGLRLSNEFYFVTPAGLLKIHEVPPECGLIEIVKSKQGLATKVTIPAPFRDIMCPTWCFVSSLCRRFDRERYNNFIRKYQIYKNECLQAGVLFHTIDKYIEKWDNFNQGDKRIPDEIAAELKLLKLELLDIIRENSEL